MIKTKTKLIIKSIILLLITLIIIATRTKSTVYGEQIRFNIDPMLIQVDLKPDSEFSYEYRVSGSKNVEYVVQAKAFIPKDKFGNLQSVEEKPEFLSWINYSKNTLTFDDEKETQSFGMNINVPENAEQKDYYFVTSITSKEITNNQTGNIISGEIQSPVLISVEDINNPLIRDGRIKSFQTNFLNIKKPIYFSLILENTGDLLFKSSGYVEIFNLVTKEKSEEYLLPQNVLAHSERQIFNPTQQENNPYISWNPKDLFGIYKATINIKYPNDSTSPLLQLQSDSIFFIYINIYLLLFIIGLIIILLITVIFLKKSKFDKQKKLH